MATPAEAPTEKLTPIVIGVEEFAQLMGVTPRTIWRWDSTGKVPEPVRVGGAVRWRLADIMKWIDAGCPERD